MGGSLWARHSLQLPGHDPQVQFDAAKGGSELARGSGWGAQQGLYLPVSVALAVFDWVYVLQVEETSVMDVIESVTPVIVKRHLSILSFKERVNFSNSFLS